MRARTQFTHLFRIGTLVAPSLIAWQVACDAPHRDELSRVVGDTLAPMWLLLTAALIVRAASLSMKKTDDPTIRVLPRLDVLTGTGSWLAWMSAGAVMLAVRLGYASLAAIGLMGGGLLHLVALYALFALRRDPLGNGTVTRSLTPITPIEGDDVTEEITIDNARIPLGYRMFISGRVGPRWATSRHVLEASDSNSTVVLESQIGPAIRGTQDAAPIELWLEDTFGLTRSHVQTAGAMPLIVNPKMRAVDKGTVPLLARGLGERIAKRTNRLPTEGNLDLREYRDGDDVRRIHWIRSLAANQLMVRLPDEIPPDRPKVRIILDTYFPDSFALDTDVPNEVLDAMVATWIAVGRAFAERGTRVTLVTAASQNGQVVPRRLELSPRQPNDALALGASITWQGNLQVDDLWTDEATFIVSHGVHTPPPDDDKFKWIIVIPGELSTPRAKLPSAARTPFPLGHRENRLGHRTLVSRELQRNKLDATKALRTMQTSVAAPPPGSLIAVALSDAIKLEVIR